MSLYGHYEKEGIGGLGRVLMCTFGKIVGFPLKMGISYGAYRIFWRKMQELWSLLTSKFLLEENLNQRVFLSF